MTEPTVTREQILAKLDEILAGFEHDLEKLPRRRRHQWPTILIAFTCSFAVAFFLTRWLYP